MKSKLALGTVQFGLDYGIDNKRGKIPKKEVFRILDYAQRYNIDVLDTAYNYGDSEKIIGEFIEKNNRSFKIISKLPSCSQKDVNKIFSESLRNLKVRKLYGYLIHSSNSFIDCPEIWSEIIKLKNNGKIDKVGFSIYYPKELEYLLDKKIKIDLIQFPYSVFDQRFSSYLPILKNKNIETYVRSVFLQGLVFKNPDELEKKFIKLKDKLVSLRLLAAKSNIPISAVCINFAILNYNIDKVLVGVDKIDSLKENIKALRYQTRVKKIYKNLSSLREGDEKIILPMNWE